jgi:murein DD-endopeptidase MepM/ murein hydrolase activator NlpD
MKFITLSILLFIVSHPFNNDVQFIHPVKDTAQIVTDFGNRSHPFLHEVKHHNGIDYKVEVGTEVWASASGIITDLGLKGSLGKTVTIDHGHGFVSIYAQLSSINELLVGDLVEQKQIIGLSGNTGLSVSPQLHFELLKDNKQVNPADYLP